MSASTKERRSYPAKTAYLVLYNGIQALGWAACLVQLWRTAGSAHSAQGVYAHMYQEAGWVARIVPSSPVMAFLQWAGRMHALFAILHSVPEVQQSVYGPVLLGVWALAEVVRYPWYALTALGSCPAALTWLRYTLFIPLYPVGVACEMLLIWLALPIVTSDGRWSIRMPNMLNFGFEYSVFLQCLLAVYPFVWWQLYASLLRQRGKRLTRV